jgi:hypothetical protein
MSVIEVGKGQLVGARLPIELLNAVSAMRGGFELHASANRVLSGLL